MPTGSASQLVHGLPTPIAAPWARLDATDDALARHAAVLATVESTFRLLVAAMLAEAPRLASEPWVQERLARGTLGALREIQEASRTATGAPDRPIARQIWDWLAEAGASKLLQTIIEQRNAFAHGRVDLDEPAVRRRADRLRADTSELLASVRWLGAFQLVFVERADLGPDGCVTARVRHFRGGAVPSRLVTASWRGSLAKDDVALLHVDRATALPLAPWVGAMHTPESGLCALGLFERVDRDGSLPLRSPLQSQTWPPQRSVLDARCRPWLRLEALVWPAAATAKRPTAAPPNADVPPGASATTAEPAPALPLARAGGAPSVSAAARIDRTPPCPSCARARLVLRAPLEPAARQFVRCDACRTVAMVQLRSGAGFAEPTEVALWSEQQPARALPSGTGPTLVCVGGPRSGETLALDREPVRLGVIGPPQHPRAVVTMVRTVERSAFAVAVKGAMRLAKDGTEADILRLEVGDRFEVGRSTFVVVSLGR